MNCSNIHQSVHLEKFPNFESLSNDTRLLRDMEIVRAICNATLSIRNAEGVKVRMPLGTLDIFSENKLNLAKYNSIIADEVNVKLIQYLNNFANIAKRKAILNLKSCGTKLGPRTKEIMSLVNEGIWELQGENLLVHDVLLSPDDFTMSIEPLQNSDKYTKYATLKFGSLSKIKEYIFIGLDTMVTDDLKKEGCVREIVRAIQNDRKALDLSVADRINIKAIPETNAIKEVLSDKQFISYITSQTLANQPFFECLEKESDLDQGLEKTFVHEIEEFGVIRILFCKK